MPTIDPHKEDFERLTRTVPLDTPVVMLNLLRYREQAAYPAGSNFTACTGREAYARYSKVALEKVKSVGGEPVWFVEVLERFIGPVGEEWHEMLLVRYPTLSAFLQMLAMPDYRAATVHRTAALEDARLIVTRAPK
jgi:uncharacterized protein (DUF1330 family)